MNIVVENITSIEKNFIPHILACVANIINGEMHIKNGYISTDIKRAGAVVATLAIKKNRKNEILISLKKVVA